MEQDWQRSALRSLVLFLVLVSPVGAPIVGYLIVYVCDISWDDPVQCVVPPPLLDYFVVFTFLPFAWVGPFLAILWLMLSAAVLLGCFCYAGKAVWQAVMERP